eukprot:1999377-Pleurochrysis_carterae.AAC.4
MRSACNGQERYVGMPQVGRKHARLTDRHARSIQACEAHRTSSNCQESDEHVAVLFLQMRCVLTLDAHCASVPSLLTEWITRHLRFVASALGSDCEIGQTLL